MAEIETQKSPVAPSYLIHNSNLQTEVMAQLSELVSITFVPWADRDTPPQLARAFLSLGDEMIRELAQLELSRQWEVGILPHPEATQAM